MHNLSVLGEVIDAMPKRNAIGESMLANST